MVLWFENEKYVCIHNVGIADPRKFGIPEFLVTP